MTRIVWVLGLHLGLVGSIHAQQSQMERPADERSAAPISDFGAIQRAKVYHAKRTTERILIDGNVNEPAWHDAAVGSDFYQTDPRNGYPATEKTEFRILYDDQNLYVSVVCHQDGPIIVSELKRDFASTDGDEIVLFLDTFNDRQNGFGFHTNPGSAMRDVQISSGATDENWDGVFSVASKIQPPGWETEFAIPLKTLRMDDTKPIQLWGLNIQRIIRYKNEWVQWSPAERPYRVFEPRIAGSLEGIEGARQGRNLYIKPFVVNNFTPDALNRHQVRAGLDLKYGVTSALTLDLTVNTDFSQVDADQQQVNLTRFSLFFPEKREFFLENSGLFNVGGADMAAAQGQTDLIPFFSRRIGLSDAGRPLPMRAGARLSGKLAGMDVGLMNIQVGAQDSLPADNWTVVRLRRNVLANSDVGGFLFNRESLATADFGRVVGLDGNFRLLQRRLKVAGFVMKNQTPGVDTKNLAASIATTYDQQLYSLSSLYVTIQDNFESDFGFVPRAGIHKFVESFSLFPRFSSGPVQQWEPRLILRHTFDRSGRLVTQWNYIGNTVTFRDGASFSGGPNIQFERLDTPFPFRSDVVIPAGDYSFTDLWLAYTSSRARHIYGGLSYRGGGFFSGTKKLYNANIGFRQSTHFQANLSWNQNIIRLNGRTLQTDLIGVQLDFAFSPKMFLQTFIQYNTDTKTVSSNIRYRFIHRPLSDLFVVYNEGRGIDANPALDRTFSVKMTQLLNF